MSFSDNARKAQFLTSFKLGLVSPIRVSLKLIKFNIEMLAPSVNQYWVQSRQGGRFITPKGVEFKRLCQEAAIRHAISVPSSWANLALEVRIQLCSPNWFKKKGGINLRRGDIDNFGKSTIDSVFKALNPLDDAQVFRLLMEKAIISPNEPENTVIEIRPL